MTLSQIVRPAVSLKQCRFMCASLLALALAPAMAHAQNCSGLPTTFGGGEFPQGNFFSNFNNPCYTISLGMGNGSGDYGDLNAQYYTLYYQVNPRYQLILVGTFPNARYYSVTLYDEHDAVAQTLLDTNIVPLTSQYTNPFQPGVVFSSGQQFAVPINFGGTPGQLETGCMMTGFNVDVNALDGTQRHAGMNWNSDAGVFAQIANFPDHIVDTPNHTVPNKGGIVMIRAYLDSTPRGYDTNPHIIVRDMASGCAYPAAYALNTLQIVAVGSTAGGVWMDHAQSGAHNTYETTYLPKLCAGNSPSSINKLSWSRVGEYVAATNPNASYITAPVPPGLPATLSAAGEVLRIRVRIPGAPPTPCTNGCSRSGTEQMRYMSLSFQNADGTVQASIADNAFTKDANGYATLIVGTGAAIPAWITPANGYTFLDLTSQPQLEQLSTIVMRHILPANAFTCGGQFVPYRMNVETPSGSLMSDYSPVADYPLAASLPAVATALVGPSACNAFPVGTAGIRPNCAVLPPAPPEISTVATECYGPGCTRFAAQGKPPISIMGANFGSFPNGLPFSGTSNYLRITDVTQNWSAGYTGNPCTVSITSWDAGLIELVASLGEKPGCPILPGDHVQVEVWNPQTMVSATSTLTAKY